VSDPLTINLNLSGFTLTLVPAVSPLRAVFVLTFEGYKIRGVAPMAYTLPVDKFVAVAVEYLDAQGNVVDLPQGNVHWETSDQTILTVEVDTGDDQQCDLLPVAVGNAQVTCTGSNPSGSQVIATLDVTCVAGDAVSGTIQPQGEPQPIPPAKRK
jgi:hypothetical protein